jgi:hypothetical protein
MRIFRFIALLGTFLGAWGSATVHFWTFTAGWDVDRAGIALSVLGIALFAFFFPAARRSNRLGIRPPSTSRPQPSLLLALAPHVGLYAVLSMGVYGVMFKLGRVDERNGHYIQRIPNWGQRLRTGRTVDTECEISFATYKKLKGYQIRADSAFMFLFYFLLFAVFALPEKPSTGQRDSARSRERTRGHL